MVKAIIGVIAALGLAVVAAHGVGSLHQVGSDGGEESSLIQRFHGEETERRPSDTELEEPATFSMAQNDDFYLCNDPFFLGIYEVITETYTIGIENVTVELLEENIFGFIRSWPGYSPEEAEGWVDHIKLIPGQFVEIAREDSAVIDNCDNFSVAMVGPP